MRGVSRCILTTKCDKMSLVMIDITVLADKPTNKESESELIFKRPQSYPIHACVSEESTFDVLWEFFFCGT